MKKLLIIATLPLIMFAATTAFAYKITKEYSTYTKGSNGHYEHLSSSNSLAPSAVGVKASAPNRSGKVKQYVEVTGFHDTTIINRTPSSQGYRYIFSVDCGSANFSHTRELVLSPGETYRSSDKSFATVQQFSPGSYRISASTRVTGESSDSATGSGTLSISK